jgi:hypothetical protein
MPYKFTGKYTDIQFAARLEISLHLTRLLTNFSVLSMDFEGNEKILYCLPKIWRCQGRNSELEPLSTTVGAKGAESGSKDARFGAHFTYRLRSSVL